jgi:hypothetical protein
MNNLNIPPIIWYRGLYQPGGTRTNPTPPHVIPLANQQPPPHSTTHHHLNGAATTLNSNAINAINMNGLPDPRMEATGLGGGGMHGSRSSLPGAVPTVSAALLAHSFGESLRSGHLPPPSAEAPRNRHSGAGTPQFRSLAGGGGQFPPLARSSRGSLSNLSCQVRKEAVPACCSNSLISGQHRTTSLQKEVFIHLNI